MTPLGAPGGEDLLLGTPGDEDLVLGSLVVTQSWGPLAVRT